MRADSRERIAATAQARGWDREPGIWCDTYTKPGRDSLYVEFGITGKIMRTELPAGTERREPRRLQWCLRYLSRLTAG